MRPRVAGRILDASTAAMRPRRSRLAASPPHRPLRAHPTSSSTPRRARPGASAAPARDRRPGCRLACAIDVLTVAGRRRGHPLPHAPRARAADHLCPDLAGFRRLGGCAVRRVAAASGHGQPGRALARDPPRTRRSAPPRWRITSSLTTSPTTSMAACSPSARSWPWRSAVSASMASPPSPRRGGGGRSHRKTLGASTGDVLLLLIGQFLRPVLLANLVAWPLAWLAMRGWLAGFDQRISLAPATSWPRRC